MSSCPSGLACACCPVGFVDFSRALFSAVSPLAKCIVSVAALRSTVPNATMCCCFGVHTLNPALYASTELLARRPFEGPEYEEEQEMDDSTPTRLSRAELEATFQASPAELSAELLRLGALEIDGKFCLMGTRYESNLMTRFFAEAAIHEWDLAAIRPSQCWATSRDLASYPRVVLRAFFSKYKKCSIDADQPGAGGASRGGGHADMHLDEGAGVANQGDPDAERISMDVAEMALFCADDLLSGSAKLLTVDEFKFAWKTMLPAKSDENLFDLATLGGRAVLEARGAQVVVKRFRVQDLSSDVKTRFRQLFQQSPMWTKEDLIPYLNDLISPSCTHDQLLLKYTRSVRTPGSDARTYTART